MTTKIRALMVDTRFVTGLRPDQVDVEEVVKDKHYIIYTSHVITRQQKMEAIEKFCGVDTILLT